MPRRGGGGRFIPAKDITHESGWYDIRTAGDNGRFMRELYDVAKAIGYETVNADVRITAEWSDYDGNEMSESQTWLFVYDATRKPWSRWIDMVLTQRDMSETFGAFASLEAAAASSSRYMHGRDSTKPYGHETHDDLEYNLDGIDNLRAKFELGPAGTL